MPSVVENALVLHYSEDGRDLIGPDGAVFATKAEDDDDYFVLATSPDGQDEARSMYGDLTNRSQKKKVSIRIKVCSSHDPKTGKCNGWSSRSRPAEWCSSTPVVIRDGEQCVRR